ncbi:uncharacterized protein LOC106151285 [Lingula anatina]|uniref:Uncharacterized protein LOC106151285 n=1 Tax=Lingula anatina TaxID=7574 RepID=A0A1S3H1V1_LINAN|nr:uncharacterized protein LOC106151285 [Lingula anatina]|eukprot:XP_013379917.1 uncharacterized protein LOC106151285 [Lingula anatina]
MNVYTPQYIRDVNGDGVPDVLLAHGGDPMRESGEPVTLSGELVILSGKYGGVLRWVKVPDHMETYFSPQLYRQSTDTLAVLFGTGGETHGGALWWIDLEDLLRGHMSKAKKLYSDPFKGIMTPPALADINQDGVEDIVIPAFNSTVVAIDGDTLQQLWKTTFTGSESYNTPAVGYYNNDDVPDFMVRYAHGPGFPVYYDSVTTILDGKTGKMLLDKPVRDSIGVQSSPLAVSVEGFGNDLFLYWVADCEDHEGQGGVFTFAEDTNVHQQSRSDVCRLRFNTRGFTKLMVSGRRTPHPGITVYDSRQRQKVEHSAWVNTTMEAIEFVKKHQQYLEDYLDHQSHRGAHQRPKNAGRKTVHHNLASRPAYTHTKGYNSDIRHSAPSYPKQNGRQKQNGRSYGRHYSNINNNGRYAEKSTGRNGFGSFSTSPSQNRNSEQYNLDKKNYGDFENLFRDYTNRNGAQYDSDKQRNKWYQNYLPVGGSQNTDRFTKKERNTYSGSKNHNPNAGYSVPSQRERLLGRKNLGQRIGRQAATRREKRHMSPHDDNGIQRLLSTGTLAPPLLNPSLPAYNNGIDLVFATYWIFPAKTEALLPEDQACVRQLMMNTSMRNDRYGKYYGLDDHAFRHAVTDECLARGGRHPPEGGTFQDAKEYNPYDLKMGQLTVYRLRLKCTCPDAGLTGGKECGSILPFHKQGWAAYMGTRGTSHFKPRKPW